MSSKQLQAQAGCSTIEVTDDASGATFPMLAMYPSDTPQQRERIGPYEIDVAMHAAPRNGTFPLVLISHGTGGSHLVYRALAHFLASHGFVVGMPEHPFNNRNDNSLENTVTNLCNRPEHLRSAINWFFASPQFAPLLLADSVAIIGHSLGGYTALAIAGGVPTCMPHESVDGQPQRVDVRADERVKALVLLAPAAVWYREPGALDAVTQPVLIMTGDKDQYTPASFHAQLILNGVPDRSRVQYQEIPGAGHFCFLSPFPPSMTNPEFAPSQDPPGFDRERFQRGLHEEILDFLHQQMACVPKD